ncbi:neogenin isoform X6 [Labeo rohita]|uniref:neogenin isoform X6 n=1 Tax=Labeo rohita TaxID=84645 RepID=UPI0021E1CE87|nr:neogenin isoform X6 [Labeo rohita]
MPIKRVNREEEKTDKDVQRVMASDVMCLCVFLLCSGLQFTTGCEVQSSYITCAAGESVLLPCRDIKSPHTDVQWWISDPQTHTPQYSVFPVDAIKGCSVSENERSVEISRYSGESVFLSCFVKCSSLYKPDSQFRWKLPNYREIIQTTELNRLYQGRFHMFDRSSGNLSLLISNLTEEDEGLYSCWSNEIQHKNFSLIIKGCTLSETKQEPKTKYTGDSVLLSCSCEDPNTKPEDFRWTRVESSGTEVSNETPRYKDRVHTFHKTTPSNLSVLISNLTEEDQGTYRCTVNNKKSTDTKLIVKGCVLTEHNNTKISYLGESVVLPCSCEDPKTKPERFEWKRAAVNETLVSDTYKINDRFQMIRDSPHHLSLRISNLMETDGGLYVCSVNGKQSTHVNLTVTDFGDVSKPIYLICLVMLLVFATAGCVYWKCTRARTERKGSQLIQSLDDEQDDTYTSVVYSQSYRPKISTDEH